MTRAEKARAEFIRRALAELPEQIGKAIDNNGPTRHVHEHRPGSPDGFGFHEGDEDDEPIPF